MASDSFQRALDLVEVERPFEALPLLNAVIAAEPERVEAYRQRAKLRRRLKDYEGAIADYTKALKLSPDAQTYLARALVWLSLDQVRGVIADSREAIALKPELAGGHRLLGKALGLLGDGVGAIAAYKSAAQCYLNDKDKKNAQACLAAIGPLQKLPPLKDASAITQGAATDPLSTDDVPSFIAVATRDPNLALAALRIEIERRVSAIAAKNGIQPRSLRQTLFQLRQAGVFDHKAIGGLDKIINAGNKAAHGAPVEPSVAKWAIDYGSSVLSVLDSHLKEP